MAIHTKKILITGGAGFIGSHLAKFLHAQGHTVVVLDRNPILHSLNKIRFYAVALESQKFSEIIKSEKPTFIYHLAGPIGLRKNIHDPAFMAASHFLNTIKNLLDALQSCDVENFCFISSGGAICADAAQIPTLETTACQPKTLYGLANLLLEKYIEVWSKIHQLPYTILRLSNAYGPCQWSEGIIPSIINGVMHNQSIVIRGDGSQVRDFLYVADVVEALSTVGMQTTNDIYNVGSGSGIRVNDLFVKISKMFHTSIQLTYTPSHDTAVNVLDITKVQKKFGWKPRISLDEGLQKTIAAFTKQ